MATSFVEPTLQLRHPVTDEVLAGGLVYTYEGGDDTPLVTFQDLDGLVENANPVVLDSAGMAQIRQTDGVAYKWVVWSVDENGDPDEELYTRDDITVGFDGEVTATYEIPMNFVGSPTESQFMGGDILLIDVLLPADFAGAQGWVATPPAADYVVSIKRNDSEVGTATIDSDGLFTFATTSALTVALVVGDRVTFVAPVATDTAADFIIKLVGTVL